MLVCVDHLARKADITLEDLALEPLITYHPSFTGRTRIDQAHKRLSREAVIWT
jgi:LysR family cys regulon transcriptional activator